jgi:hypothetical protein
MLELFAGRGLEKEIEDFRKRLDLLIQMIEANRLLLLELLKHS